MTQKIFAAICVLIFSVAGLGITYAQSTAPITGQWTLADFVVQDYVQLSMQRTGPNYNMSSSSPVLLSQLVGLTRAQLASPGSTVRFNLARDAGLLQFQGYVQGGAGGGTFIFSPNPNFAGEMSALGYRDLTPEKIFSMAVHDVSSGYVRDLQAAGLRPESADKLVSMRIHGVSLSYVQEFRGLGYSTLTADKLVSMRIHGVAPEFVRDLNGRGYNGVSADKLVSMRIHGVTTEFIDELQGLGYAQPSIDQLVSMRIHGVTAELIRRNQSPGLGNIPINKLLEMKIHGLLR
jgi:hypothetical protein